MENPNTKEEKIESLLTAVLCLCKDAKFPLPPERLAQIIKAQTGEVVTGNAAKLRLRKYGNKAQELLESLQAADGSGVGAATPSPVKATPRKRTKKAKDEGAEGSPLKKVKKVDEEDAKTEATDDNDDEEFLDFAQAV